MLSRHSRDFDRRFPLAGIGSVRDINKHVLEEIEIMYGCEGFIFALAGEMLFGVRCGDDGKISAQ